jgi:hypothetical protein
MAIAPKALDRVPAEALVAPYGCRRIEVGEYEDLHAAPSSSSP